MFRKQLIVALIAAGITCACAQEAAQPKPREWETALSQMADQAEAGVSVYFLAPSDQQSPEAAEYGTRAQPRPRFIGTLSAADLRDLAASELYPDNERDMLDCAYMLEWRWSESAPALQVELQPLGAPVITLMRWREVGLLNPQVFDKLVGMIKRDHQSHPGVAEGGEPAADSEEADSAEAPGPDTAPKLAPQDAALLRAASAGDASQVRALLESGADVNARDREWCGNTPLLAAAAHGSAEGTRLLLAAGADVNARNADGETPLHDAAEHGSAEGSRLLLAAGAHVNARDAAGRSVLRRAVSGGKPEVLRMLLERADVNARDAAGETPLFSAAFLGKADLLRLLLDAGADVNARDADGSTPLHRAALAGQEECLRLLLDAGADVNAVNRRNRSPLNVATLARRDEIVELLRARGAKD